MNIIQRLLLNSSVNDFIFFLQKLLEDNWWGFPKPQCCKQMNPVGLHVTTQNYNQYLISRYKRNQSRKTKQYHYQFPKVNQMFCYIKHCNHLFCPDFAKAIKYGCESFKIKSIFLRSIPHAQPYQAASTGLRKFSTQLVHLLKRCIKYKIASVFLLSGENSTWDIKRPEYGSK